MSVIDTKTFKSGNSVAVRLPKELGYAEGEAVRIESDGKVLTIHPAKDLVAERQKVLDLVAALRALGPAEKVGERPGWDWPDRGGRV